MVNAFGGEWTRDKLRILEGYLKAYTTALKRQPFRLWYVDAFAGTGYVDTRSGDAAQSTPLIPAEEWDTPAADVLKGSARVALEVDDKPFDEFVFVEQNPECAMELSRLKEEFSGRSIRVVRDDANKFLPAWCADRNQLLGTPWRGERAVVFLDPFGAQVDWETIQSISATKSVDLWILFPLSALTRMMPTDREPDGVHLARLDRVFGGKEWQGLYSAQVQRTLFGDESQVVRRDQQAVVELYLEKLRTIFPAVATETRWFRNSRNLPLFAFMFAASNPGRGGQIAVNIADHLLEHW